MDTLCAGLVSQSYAQQGLREITARNRLAKDLYSQRKLPGHGWDEMDIERFFAVRLAGQLYLWRQVSPCQNAIHELAAEVALQILSSVELGAGPGADGQL